MSFDLILKNARISGSESGTVDIGISGGKIAVIQPHLAADGETIDLGGRLVSSGLIETHIHLDKSCILGRCQTEKGTLDEAIAAVAAAKRDFTEADVFERASRTLEKAILQGTMRMRTHVEVDPRIGLTSVRALLRLKQAYAWAIGIEICVFPQEGLLDDPGCEAVMVEALDLGADVVGGAPYMDKDSHGQIARIFALAQRFEVDIDFHLDFGLDPSHLDVDEVCRKTDEYGWGGRVAVGHVTKFSSLPPERFEAVTRRLEGSGVAVTVLPSTDLFLTGREHDHAVPRGVTPLHRFHEQGVTCSLSTNNVLNPFTPFGDCSLIRMANLYANVAQVGTPGGMAACLDMVTSKSAKLMNLEDYGLVPGNPADLIVLDCTSPAEAVSEIAPVLTGFKGGLRTFSRAVPVLHRPTS